MESVSRTDPDKNHQAPNGTATPAAEEQQHDRSSPLPTSDRIRSHVARRSTETPTNWSLSSTESLFSIHEANTSFGKEFRSGEFPGYDYISSPLLELPTTSTKSGNLDEGAAEAMMQEVFTEQECQQKDDTPAATMEVFTEQECQQKDDTPAATMEVFTEQECQQKDDTRVEFSPHSRSTSVHSDTSVNSFAFPVLAGEGDNYVSLKKSTKNKKEQLQPSTSLEENPDISQENPKPIKTQTQKYTKNAGLKKWFGCFSCGPSSS